MGGTFKIGPIGLTFKLDLLVVLGSIWVKFGSDSSDIAGFILIFAKF